MPQLLVDRIKKERRELFLQKNRNLLDSLYKRRDELSSKSKDENSDEKNLYEDILKQIECLKEIESSFVDSGPIFDVICFKDSSSKWRVVIDIHENGDLSGFTPMTNYRDEYQVSNFGDSILLNFVVNIWNDGNIVEIVTDSGSHGTHVACISSGYFKDKPELNGIAPGSQVISFKIGDSRLNGMETGTGFMRAISLARRLKVDLINISFGEYTNECDKGRVTEYLREIIEKDGIIVVSSASNSGPCLSTTSAPGSSTQGAISVAAYISEKMIKSQHLFPSLKKDYEWSETMKDWSSRGPTEDGSLGVSVCAPGGAIASVPNWTLRQTRLMEGTSMASPNACGCLGLILSGLKKNDKKYSPFTIKMAIENTARRLINLDYWTQGYGLIQVKKAFDLLMHKVTLRDDIRIECRENITNKRGIYIRDIGDINKDFKKNFNLNIIVDFNDERSKNKDKVDFTMNVDIESTVPWIIAPSFGVLTNGSVLMKVKLDTSFINKKEYHGTYYGEIIGYDQLNRSQGPIFRYPVTLIQPYHINTLPYHYEEENINLIPGETKVRRFFNSSIPNTYAIIKIEGDIKTSTQFFFGSIQLLKHISPRYTHIEKVFSLQPNGPPFKVEVPVVPENVIEICFSHFWKSLDTNGPLRLSIHFNSFTPLDNYHIVQNNYNETTIIHMKNQCNVPLPIEIKASIYSFKTSLYPKDIKGPYRLNDFRDDLGSSRHVYEMIIEYHYKTESNNCNVLLKLQNLYNVLYESPYDSQLIMIYDKNKKYIGSSDAFPSFITLKEKGKYIFRAQLRHENLSLLESRKNQILILERKLSESKRIHLSIKGDLSSSLSSQASVSSQNNNGFRMNPSVGQLFSFYITSPSENNIPSYIKPGYTMCGVLTFNDDMRKGKAFDSHGIIENPGSLPYSFNVPESSKTSTKTESSSEYILLPSYLSSKLKNLIQNKQFDDSEKLIKYIHIIENVREDHPMVKECELIYEMNKNPNDYDHLIDLCDKLIQSIGPMDKVILKLSQGGEQFLDEEKDKDIIKNASKYKDLILKTLKQKMTLYKQKDDHNKVNELFDQYNKWISGGSGKSNESLSNDLKDIKSWIYEKKKQYGNALQSLLSGSYSSRYNDINIFNRYISILKDLNNEYPNNEWSFLLSIEEYSKEIHFPSNYLPF